MEDYFWILILGAFWLFEIVGKAVKKKNRQAEDGEPGTPRPDSPSSRRDVSRELDASARRAEDALLRRETRQREVVPAPAPTLPVADRRAEKISRRRETFEAIASMLVVPPEKAQQAPATREQAQAVQDRRAARVTRPPTVQRPVDSTSRPVVRRSTRRGLERLAGLSDIQRAVVLSEILGPPVSSGRKNAFHLDY